MQILIAYASIEGQTRKIAHFLQDRLLALGHQVTLADVGETHAAVDLDASAAVILAASVHQRRHPDTFEAFIIGARDALSARPTLMLSVSLKAAFAEGRDEAQDYLDEMQLRTDWSPDRSLLVAGAVRARSYDYFETQVLRHVVLDGVSFDPADGPHEFTDWDALDQEVRAFVDAALTLKE